MLATVPWSCAVGGLADRSAVATDYAVVVPWTVQVNLLLLGAIAVADIGENHSAIDAFRCMLWILELALRAFHNPAFLIPAQSQRIALIRA